MRRFTILLLGAACAAAAPGSGPLKVRVSWGHQAPRTARYYVRLAPATAGVSVLAPAGHALEAGEGLRDGAWQTAAGAGDVDGVDFTLACPEEPVRRLQNLHIIWADLIAGSDPDTARRLSRDPAFEPNAPKLTVFTNAEGTRGFTVSVTQLRAERALWVPSLDIYVAAGEPLVTFAEHRKQLTAWQGRRILDQVRRQPEASYEQYKSLWEDMGSPGYVRAQQPPPGHIVCLTWDSAIAKFGVDRGAGVRNDLGNPDHFQFWFDFGDLTKGITNTWRGQRLENGLPVITTVFEQDGIRYEVEQFAYPLDGPPGERRGDIPMVLLQKVRLTELRGAARTVPVTMAHRRQFPKSADSPILTEQRGDAVLFEDAARRQVLFAVQGAGNDLAWGGVRDYQKEMKRVNATAWMALAARGTREFVVKLPSPMASPEEAATLTALDYRAARAATLKFWGGWVERGAQFRVPEKAVNDLFRASLWHALRLPRRHGGPQDDVKIDLPYSNFAYSQTGTPWPVNQAVYVDYMLYALRGYFPAAAEELRVQYRNNQEPNGHVKGFANWGVYTPGMLYAVAQNYLLSRDRALLDPLLPPSLKALDWCLEELRRAAEREGPARGLVSAPLNDGTGEGLWAFNQAYMYAGLELFGRVLEEIGHPRAREARAAAGSLRAAIERGFGAASARSPLVQLRDHTWTPYVPCEALTPRRILEQWYPTDVDTGAAHLLRLDALAPDGPLADALLHDHEDNLYLKGWGMANEPVYHQQGAAYLRRDDAKAAIRTFYSYMASAFSHSVFEPVEHRWTHGQYFGPPSTDGAWFELYRNMLVRETEDGSLLLGQATPRKWLEEGKKIEVTDAPTWYGKLTMTIESRAKAGEIAATVAWAGPRRPRALLVRLRHPEAARIRSVTVNGQAWKDFEPDQEWIRISSPDQGRYSFAATY
jgi:hypothetical protein